jgi:uncharacterized protein (TIGR03067 family)
MRNSLLVSGAALTVLILLAPWAFPPLAVQAGEPREEKEELEGLQGTWKCLRWEQDGKLMPEEATKSRNTFVRIKGHGMEWQAEGFPLLEGTIELDATKNPKHIILHCKKRGETYHLIYSRDGREVIVCHGAPNGPCPKELKSGTPDGGPSLYVWKIER